MNSTKGVLEAGIRYLEAKIAAPYNGPTRHIDSAYVHEVAKQGWIAQLAIAREALAKLEKDNV